MDNKKCFGALVGVFNKKKGECAFSVYCEY